MFLYMTDYFLDAWRIKLVLEYTQVMATKLILPVITFWGILLLALPLRFFFFLGTWILLAYSSALIFSKMNQS